MTGKQHYLYRLNPPRPSFFADQTGEEQAIMGRHIEYWTANLAEGKAVAFGPVLDPNGAWGVAIIEVASEAEARQLRDADPVVTSGLGSIDIHQMPTAAVRPYTRGS